MLRMKMKTMKTKMEDRTWWRVGEGQGVFEEKSRSRSVQQGKKRHVQVWLEVSETAEGE